MREPGYYFVKPINEKDFIICEFTGEHWLIPSDDPHTIMDWPDKWFSEIDETRITKEDWDKWTMLKIVHKHISKYFNQNDTRGKEKGNS